MPIRFAYFLVEGMDAVMHCEINIGDTTKAKVPKINFTNVSFKEGDTNKAKIRFQDINSDDLTKEESQFYMAKFESEILSRLRVKWVRNESSDFEDFISIMAIPVGIIFIALTILVVLALIIIFSVHYYKKRRKRRSQA